MSGTVFVGRLDSWGIRQLALAGLVLGIVVVVMTEARTALALGPAPIGLMEILRGRGTAWYSALLALPVLGSLLLIVGTDVVPDSWWESIGAWVRRPVSLSNRELIWRAILRELSDIQPVNLAGYGAYSQIRSGWSQSCSPSFAVYNDPSTAGTHNGFLPQAIDTRYLGAALVLGTLVLAMRRLAVRVGLDRGSRQSEPLLGLPVFIVTIGMVESSWSPEGEELQILMLHGPAWAAMLPHIGGSTGDSAAAAIVPSGGTSELKGVGCSGP